MAFFYDAPLPSPGLPVRLQLTGVQWLLECEREACRCVAIGREILFQGRVALPQEGQLVLRCRPPELPIEVVFDHVLVFAPRTTMQGWLALPLSQCLAWRDPEGRTFPLVQIEDPGLATAWRDELGYLHPFRTKLEDEPRRTDEDEGLRFWLRLRLRNDGRKVRRVERLLLDTQGREIWSVRGGVPIGPAARVRLGGKQPELHWRELPIVGRGGIDDGRYRAEEPS